MIKTANKRKLISSKNLDNMVSPLTLMSGQQVILQNIKTKRWNIPATVLEVRGSGRSAWVATDSGRKYLRNRRFMRTPTDQTEEGDDSQADSSDDEDEHEDEEEELLSALAFTGCRRTESSPTKISRLSLQNSRKVSFRTPCSHRAFKDDSGTDKCKGTIVFTDADTDGCCCRQQNSTHPLCINSIDQ
jgi:hypothetical protein